MELVKTVCVVSLPELLPSKQLLTCLYWSKCIVVYLFVFLPPIANSLGE